MIVVESIAALREQVARARQAQRRVGLVPTMGYLHEGHLSLVDVARQRAQFVVASIFVNPLQFGPTEDLARYPRDLERDNGLLRQRAVDLVFAPAAAALYPDGDPPTRVHAPALTDRLDGLYRPGHFDGVLTVVAKLFNLVRPDLAVFGQKDLQQAALVRRMIRDLDFDIELIVAPIVREPDGLAMSSRNTYLSADERQSALALSRALRVAQQAFSAGEHDPAALIGTARDVLDNAAGVRAQYVEIVDPATLVVPTQVQRGHALAVAAFVGTTRLIDNLLLD